MFHVLPYVKAVSPPALEHEKVNRLFQGLPHDLKAYFVRDNAEKIFINVLKDFARE